MNILRLTTRIYPDKGGPAVYAYNLSKNISKKSFRFFNISCNPFDFRKDFSEINSNFEIYYLHIQIPSKEDSILKKMLFIIKFVSLSFKKIIKIHRIHGIDIIHCDNPVITGLVAIIFKKIFKIPFIYTQHGIDSPYKLEYLLEIGLIHRFSSKYVLISRKMRLFFEKNRVNTENLVWIPNGIAIQEFFHVKNGNHKKDIIKELNLSTLLVAEDYIIIYVGYMVFKQKVRGMIDFLYAFKNFLSMINESEKARIKLLYLGDGKLMNLLENELIKLNLKENVFLLGNRLKIKKFYAISDLCCLTSYIEGFPTVLLEATASKVPCISTDVGEVREILSDESIIPVGDRKMISEKLYELFKKEKLREEILKKSFEKIENFDWHIIAKQFKALYIQIKIGKS